jgi:sigma-B regulation protein RsbQ
MRNAIVRNNVKISGQGQRTMICAHGFGCDQSMWRFVVPEFEADYRVVLFDHVGHGNSDVTAFDKSKYGSLHGYAEDVREICNELRLRDAVFVGHSVSAMIGVLAALDDPGLFRALVLVGPSPRYVNDDNYTGGFSRQDIDGLLDFLEANHLGWSSQMAPVIMGNAERPGLSLELTNSFCRTDPEIALHFARVTFLSDNRADLARLKTRSLILQCSDDVIAPRCVGEYVHRQVENSRIVYLSATGHCPNLSAPGETVAAIREFLASDESLSWKAKI